MIRDNKLRYILSCIYNAVLNTINDDGVEHAGYMAFMVLLAVFPFIVFFLAFTSFIGASDLGIDFIDFLVNNLPNDTTSIVKERLIELTRTPPQSLLTLAIIGSIWTSSSFVEGLRTILNRVYKIPTLPSYIFRRLSSILQFFIIIGLMFIAMVILVIFPILLNKIPKIKDALTGYSPFWTYCRYMLIFISLFFSVSWLYYMIPNIKIKFREVIPGSIITVILWLISARLLSEYIHYYNQLSLVYGSLGSIIVTLLFFYLVNMFFIYGAELNQLLYKQKKF